jgi:molybdopterin/thiamine biosynthesis adenylyltransferase/ubiquitin-protein ligase
VTWYIEDVARWKAERQGLETFGAATEWFEPVGWRVDADTRLILDADITVGGKKWPIFLRFPDFFPHSPPSVFPRGDDTRWSAHQYGPGGELCLEYGPDTWTPDLTGVHLIESAYRLLQGENPTAGQSGVVPSRHVESVGEQFRRKAIRFLMTRNLAAGFAAVQIGEPVSALLISTFHKDSSISTVRQITRGDGSVWTETGVPVQLGSEYYERTVPLIRIEPSMPLPPTISRTAFLAASVAFNFAPDGDHAIILRGDEVHQYLLWQSDDSVARLPVIPAQKFQPRLDESHARLKGKKFGLVGCGSMGSKIAAMLARAGAGKALLVDDDVLLSDNLVRHDLDWRDVGTHKVDAVARRLQLVNPSVATEVWKARIGGQTSAASAESILNDLGECDVMIDATANPDVLNLLSALGTAKSKPVVWGEVFAGGIGGLVARFRPAIDPPPQYMRRAIENWFDEQNAPPVRVGRSYATGGDGPPLIADDADVSVVAAHVARFAIDLLTRDVSIFPNSVYAVGLAAGSVFTQPFDTRPIDVGLPPAQKAPETLTEEERKTEIGKIVELFIALSNEVAATPANNQAPAA